MDEQTKAALASAAESVKQLITLATALLGFEITFAKDFLAQLSVASRYAAEASWLCFLFSVVVGVWTMLAITGSLAQQKSVERNSIFAKNIRVPSVIQILLFLVGLVLTVSVGMSAISSFHPGGNATGLPRCNCETAGSVAAQSPSASSALSPHASSSVQPSDRAAATHP
jgi:hypothetical protein